MIGKTSSYIDSLRERELERENWRERISVRARERGWKGKEKPRGSNGRIG